MIALYHGNVPLVFAEGIGRRSREGLLTLLERMSPLVRSFCTVEEYDGPYPLAGAALVESTLTYHAVICPLADGVKVLACARCQPEDLP